MDFINLKSLNLTAEESEDLIKLLAQKRGITTEKLLSTIKLNLKRKNNKDLASKSQQKLIKSIKSQQKLVKTQLELIKSLQKLIKSIKKQQKFTKQTKSQRELIKSQRELKKQQQTLSNTKKNRNSARYPRAPRFNRSNQHHQKYRISHYLTKAQPSPCNTICGCKFHTLATHPHPTFATPQMSSLPSDNTRDTRINSSTR